MPSATAYWVWKAVLAAALGTLVLVAVARDGSDAPQAAVVLVGLNPLVLVYGSAATHNEPLMLLFAVAAITLAVDRWHERGARGGRRRRRLRRPGGRVRPRPPCWPRSSCCLPSAPARPGGAGGAGALVLAVVGLVYGGHLPATGIQDGLVGPLSVPNVPPPWPATGHDGHDRTIAHGVLALAAIGATDAGPGGVIVAAGRRRLGCWPPS